jgi:hypothetical protein
MARKITLNVCFWFFGFFDVILGWAGAREGDD